MANFRYGYANPSKVTLDDDLTPIPARGRDSKRETSHQQPHHHHDQHQQNYHRVRHPPTSPLPYQGQTEIGGAGVVAETTSHNRHVAQRDDHDGSRSDDGGQHSWDFVKVIRLPDRVTSPRLFCPINDNFLVLGDTMSGLVYAVDLATEKSSKLDLGGHVIDCAYDMKTGTFYASEFPSGRICAYNREGVKIRDLHLPGEPSTSNAVAVDMRGLVVSAPICGKTNKVYFIDPRSGHVVKRGSVEAEEIKGEIDILPASGMIVVRTDDDEFTVLSGDDGTVRGKMKREDWNEARFAPDPFINTLYVCYIRDIKAKPAVAVFDEVSVDGGMLRRGVLQLKQLSRPVITPLFMPKGQMVFCNGKELLVYQKTFILGSQAGHTWLKV